jgi:hypothetical protein
MVSCSTTRTVPNSVVSTRLDGGPCGAGFAGAGTLDGRLSAAGFATAASPLAAPCTGLSAGGEPHAPAPASTPATATVATLRIARRTITEHA